MEVHEVASGHSQTVEPIAFVSGDTAQMGKLSRVLRRAVGQVSVHDSVQQLEDSECALVAVDYDTLSDDARAELIAAPVSPHRRPALVLLSRNSALRDFAGLFEARALTNMLVINDSGVDVSDLFVTVQKIRRGEIFGLEKYFVWGVEPRSLRIASSQDRPRALDMITDYAESIGIIARLRNAIRTVADEFITNAVYNAPVNADGSRPFHDQPRTQRVYLNPGDEPEMRYCCDGRRFGISITDRFGSLSPARLQEYLARGFRGGAEQVSEKDGGAGLGFFQILGSLSHFVVNIEPGKRTEMIGLVDVSGGYRAFAEAGKSFNIFVQGQTP